MACICCNGGMAALSIKDKRLEPQTGALDSCGRECPSDRRQASFWSDQTQPMGTQSSQSNTSEQEGSNDSELCSLPPGQPGPCPAQGPPGTLWAMGGSQGRIPEAPTSLWGTQGKMVTTLSLLCQGY